MITEMTKNTDQTREYIIVCPQYTRSNGVRALYDLSKEIKKRGYKAQLLSYGYDGTGYKFVDNITEDMRDNAIIVYPEVIVGNPLRARNVVRYVLFYPGQNGGVKQYHHNELVFTYNKDFFATEDILTVPYIDENLFFDDKSVKTEECYFVHKGGKWKDVPELTGMTEINMSYPATREKLAELLRGTKTLYSYDACSAMLDEAVCCGCEVRIIAEDGYVRYSSAYYEVVKDFEQQIEKFIEITQSRNWTGAIEITRVKLIYKIEIYCKFYWSALVGNKKKHSKYKWLKLLYLS